MTQTLTNDNALFALTTLLIVVVVTAALTALSAGKRKMFCRDDDPADLTQLLADPYQHPLNTCLRDLRQHAMDRVNLPEQGPLHMALLEVYAWVAKCRHEDSIPCLQEEVRSIHQLDLFVFLPPEVKKTLSEAQDLLNDRISHLTNPEGL